MNDEQATAAFALVASQLADVKALLHVSMKASLLLHEWLTKESSEELLQQFLAEAETLRTGYRNAVVAELALLRKPGAKSPPTS